MLNIDQHLIKPRTRVRWNLLDPWFAISPVFWWHLIAGNIIAYTPDSYARRLITYSSPVRRLIPVIVSSLKELKSYLSYLLPKSKPPLHVFNTFAARPKKYNTTENSGKTANTACNIISYTTVICIAYLASPDLSGTLGIIIYFLRRKYPADKAAKGLNRILLQYAR